MTRRYYRELRLKGFDNRRCINCNSTTTWVNKKNDKKQWHTTEDGYLCKKCYNKLISNPKLNKMFNDKYNKISINILGLRAYLSFEPRKGFCSWCSNNIFDGSTKRTSMHHWFYVPIMPWACTEEICNTCHGIHHKSLKSLLR